MRVDLNADVGESPSARIVDHDTALMSSVTSVSVAAGVHAGDPSTLREMIRRARAAGVAVGVHPGFADRAHAGRRELALSPGKVEDLVLYQVAAVLGVAAAEGVALQHVKLHGALYTMAAGDATLAAAAARAVASCDRALIMFAPHGSALFKAARAVGLATVAEAFADRAYETNGALVSRSRPGAVLTDPEIIVSRSIRFMLEGFVESIEGMSVPLKAETICVHSDTPGAAEIARRLRSGLEQAGITVVAPRAPGLARGEVPFN